MNYIFGPVFSRRLGLSLGIDLVPHKVCSMDCLYCEVGKTTKKTLERAEYVPFDAVKNELREFLSYKPEIDYITFSGYGEPTLFSRLGELVRWIKENYSYKLALLTNASLFYQEDVLQDINGIDIILPSLDAATQKTFEKINRPSQGLNIEMIVEGIEKLIKKCGSEVWIETLFVKGINDSEEEIERIGKIIHRLKPQKWQINTVARPPAYNVVGLSFEELKRIKEKIGYPATEIVAISKAEKKKMPISEIKEEIYNLVKRRPCPIDEIASALGILEDEAERAVNELLSEEKVEKVLFGNIPYIKGKV
ncbi:radical SAM protein [Desulfurobacterium thermolithotrophum]|uniref:radical SAM protein n=1 Tax=Desulfurobacterium thermolithotrophum TaxID=64160 RepID=UPI0013D85BBB|nr:radical SAM protein [Desulfurobacterium thermolithotrophum]